MAYNSVFPFFDLARGLPTLVMLANRSSSLAMSVGGLGVLISSAYNAIESRRPKTRIGKVAKQAGVWGVAGATEWGWAMGSYLVGKFIGKQSVIEYGGNATLASILSLVAMPPLMQYANLCRSVLLNDQKAKAAIWPSLRGYLGRKVRSPKNRKRLAAGSLILIQLGAATALGLSMRNSDAPATAAVSEQATP